MFIEDFHIKRNIICFKLEVSIEWVFLGANERKKKEKVEFFWKRGNIRAEEYSPCNVLYENSFEMKQFQFKTVAVGSKQSKLKCSLLPG